MVLQKKSSKTMFVVALLIITKPGNNLMIIEKKNGKTNCSLFAAECYTAEK